MNYEEKILEALAELKAEVSDIRAAQTEMQTTQTRQGEQLTALQATQTQQGGQLAALQATQTQQGEQLTRLEEKVDELDERSLRTAVLLESDIAPKVQLLLDGHTHLVDTLAPKKRVEKVEEIVEERVFVLESVVKSHAERINRTGKGAVTTI